MAHSQGLLFRATESLLEFRTSENNSGYFARLDYVAFVAQELGFSPDKSAHEASLLLGNLLLRNFLVNHILNLVCTIGDSGALGAILWGFEIRELDCENVETMIGARLHANLGGIGTAGGSGISSVIGGSCNFYHDNWANTGLLELILFSGTATRISRGRLANNFLVSSEVSTTCGNTGYLLSSTGISDLTEDFSIQNLNSEIILGNLSADSLQRHIARSFSVIL